MNDAAQKLPILFLDFDGTISERDAIDAILEAFADRGWLALEEEWKAGRIGSRECLRAQMSLVRAKREEVNALLDSIKVDPGFAALLETCASHRVPVHIVSDGFDYCIRRILAGAGARVVRSLERVRVFSSRLKPEGDRWHVEFPFYVEACAHGCATCKPAVMRRRAHPDALSIFVGDGLSDRYAAQSADLVFAKKSLATYCREQSIPFVAYDDLDKVSAYLESLLSASDLDVREMAQAMET